MALALPVLPLCQRTSVPPRSGSRASKRIARVEPRYATSRPRSVGSKAYTLNYPRNWLWGDGYSRKTGPASHCDRRRRRAGSGSDAEEECVRAVYTQHVRIVRLSEGGGRFSEPVRRAGRGPDAGRCDPVLIVAHSLEEGGYRAPWVKGTVDSRLTCLYSWCSMTTRPSLRRVGSFQ